MFVLLFWLNSKALTSFAFSDKLLVIFQFTFSFEVKFANETEVPSCTEMIEGLLLSFPEPKLPLFFLPLGPVISGAVWSLVTVIIKGWREILPAVSVPLTTTSYLLSLPTSAGSVSYTHLRAHET